MEVRPVRGRDLVEQLPRVRVVLGVQPELKSHYCYEIPRSIISKTESSVISHEFRRKSVSEQSLPSSVSFGLTREWSLLGLDL